MKKILSIFVMIIAGLSLAHADGLTPNPGGPRPPHEPPPWGGPGGPKPPNQPPPPGWGDVYGPGRTVRWQDMGVYRAQKIIETRVRLDARQQFVNEVYVRGQGNQVDIKSAVAYMSNGQAVELRNLLGTIREGQQYRTLLDYRNSLRIEKIELVIESGLIGGRGEINVQLGLAY